MSKLMQLDRYKMIKAIGEGSFGKVYLAHDERMDRRVAIKLVKLNENTINEFSILKKLDHKGLPRVYDFIKSDDTAYIVMEYIEGISMKEYLDSKGILSVELTIDIIKQLIDILMVLHNMKPSIIYRDLKPENIIVRADLSIALIDFGAAFSRDYSGNDGRNVYGTRGYSAPELFEYKIASKASDIYSLGMLMHAMLTGRLNISQLMLNKPVREYNCMVSKYLEKVIVKCLMKEPKERYQTLEELLIDINKCKENERSIKIMMSIKKSIVILGYVLALILSCNWIMGANKGWGIVFIKIIFSLFMAFLLHYFLMFKRLDDRVFRVNKEIFLTSKKYVGLFSLAIFALGLIMGRNINIPQYVYAQTDAKKMWVDMKDATERKLLLKAGNEYYVKDKLRLEIPSTEIPSDDAIIQVIATGSDGQKYISQEFKVTNKGTKD